MAGQTVEDGPLARFVEAQDGVYPRALAEVRAGAKQTHWIWFVFPQIEGLGQSPTARFYAIADGEEARAYSRHPLLGPRLAECTDAMLRWAGERSAEQILGAVDAQKFRSCMTLFERCADDPASFAAALEAFYSGSRDEATLARL